jgi:hypothetical protein
LNDKSFEILKDEPRKDEKEIKKQISQPDNEFARLEKASQEASKKVGNVSFTPKQ